MLSFHCLIACLALSAVYSSPITIQKFDKPSARLFRDTSYIVKHGRDLAYIYNEERESWYSYRSLDKVTTKLAPKIFPISACLDTTSGTTGSVSLKYSVSLAFVNTITAQIGYKYLLNADFGWNINAYIGTIGSTSMSFSSSVSCGAIKGKVVQVFLQPYYVVTPEILIRKISIDGDDVFEIVPESSEEMVVPSVKVFAKHPAQVYCAYGDTPASDLQCDKWGDLRNINPDDFL